MAVCWRRGSRSEAAKDDIAGSAPVQWRVAKLERQRGEAQDGVVELARVRTARLRLQLLAVEGVAVEVAVDDDVGVSAPAARRTRQPMGRHGKEAEQRNG